MNQAYADILEVLRCYYEGLYRCDVKLLSSVFHPQARYYRASDSELFHLDMGSYLPLVGKRTAPEARGEPYGYEVESITFAGPVTAMARMKSTLWDKRFDDFLALVRTDGEWKIISKVFHFEEVDGAQA